jgi:lipoprotein-anchoring transpeptidase ErfK/SrfK
MFSSLNTLRRAGSVALLGAFLAACGTTGPSRPTASTPPSPSAAEIAAAQAELEAIRRGLETKSTEMSYRKEELERLVAAHVEGRMSLEAREAFPFVMFISKSAEGPIAQHAFLFETGADGSLKPLDTWLVSTGRENSEISPKGEQKFTRTPAGVYSFNHQRFVRLHKSNAWEADMPWAMFFGRANWGAPTGYALHAALDKYVPNLGQRASAGCIRLMPANAERLYKLLLSQYRGPTKRFTVSGSKIGVTGGTYDGIQAIVIIEDLDGYALLGETPPVAMLQQ